MSVEVPNVLAQRYASGPMRRLWSPEGRVVREREFWIAVMRAQRSLGVGIPAEAIAAYEKVKDKVDLGSIERRERVSLHDVKARIEEFNALAGHETIHLGLTSRDLTECVEQLQVLHGLAIVRMKSAAALARLAKRARQWSKLVITARTHNVPAQATTLGKRLAMSGEELLAAHTRLEGLLETYPARGVQGAVGTQLDLLSLLGGKAESVDRFTASILKHLGFKRGLGSVGQVYPRSLDFEVVSALFQIACAAASFATTWRLMAGQGLVTEGFAPGQTGSSAMPHKTNARNCERVCALRAVLAGHVAMASEISGVQWNEGDVACSAVRRVMLPDAFFAIDGLLETLLTVLDRMEVFPNAIAAENRLQLPFLATTTVLMAAVKRGLGRETAHGIIKQHSLAAARALRDGDAAGGDLIARLAGDDRLGLDLKELRALVGDGSALTGLATRQALTFANVASSCARRAKGATAYVPEPIL
jgi:adenylosuccinate lyase